MKKEDYEQWEPKLTPRVCPFCKEIPSLFPIDPDSEGDAFGMVLCINEGCPVQPQCKDGCDVSDMRGPGAYIDLAISRWNQCLTGDGRGEAIAQWVAAYAEYSAAVIRYNDRLAFARTQEFGEIDCNPEYQLMEVARRKTLDLMPLYEALVSTPTQQQQATPGAVPDGWPTSEMCGAGAEALDIRPSEAKQVFLTMLAAAPKPQDKEPK